MATPFQCDDGSRLGIFFSGEDQNDISRFIAKRHAIRKRVFARRPPYIRAQGFVAPCSRDVKGLMPERPEHGEQLLLGAFAFCFCNEANDAWHLVLSSAGNGPLPWRRLYG